MVKYCSGYCLIFFCFSGSFYQNLLWMERKKKKKTGKCFCCTVYTVCTFLRTTEVRDGKATFSHWVWIFGRFLNHLLLWQMTSRETLWQCQILQPTSVSSIPRLEVTIHTAESAEENLCLFLSKSGHELWLLKWSQPLAEDCSGDKQVPREGYGAEVGET